MKTKNKSKTEKTKKVENVQVVHAVEPTTEDKQARKQEIIDTTVKIVSGFSDMIAS
jgi:hypothetical protein